MKIRYIDGKRKGTEADMLDAAGKRLIASGLAEEVQAEVKKAPAKKAEAKKSDA